MQTVPRLPPDYYLTHFRAVTQGVGERYGFVLNAAEHAHLATLDALPLPAAMLYARLVNRAGPCFRVARLAYWDIDNMAAAIDALCDAGLLEFCRADLTEPAPQALLTCFTQPELRAGLRGHPCPANFTKPQRLAWLAGWPDLKTWLASFLADRPAIRLKPEDPWKFMRFLFFGELRPNLADFVTRDLGHIVTETIAPQSLRPLFASRAAADDGYKMACLYEIFRALRDTQPALATLAWWQDQAISRAALLAGHPWHDRLVEGLGRRLEREAEPQAALALYATSPAAPSRERRARLLLKFGDRQTARALLQEIESAPNDSAEAYAARQLLARLQTRARRTQARAYQQASRTLILDYQNGAVEAAVLAHYRAAGWHGVHAENWLFNACFGLLLWDIIFDPALGVFHSPLQFAPSDLLTPLFYANRRDAIETRLTLLQNPEAALALIKDHHDAKQGIANPFVGWHETLPSLIVTLIKHVPPASLVIALRHLAQNPGRHASGLPDLFIWNDAGYRFVEIKSENDTLSGHQYEWLIILTAAGINAELNRVQRPEQASSSFLKKRTEKLLSH
jgi:hypothetical protein